MDPEDAEEVERFAQAVESGLEAVHWLAGCAHGTKMLEGFYTGQAQPVAESPRLYDASED